MTDTAKKAKRVSFRLYALPTTAEATARAGEHRFSRIAPSYTLIYTDRRKPDGGILLGAKDAERLTEADKKWLLDCNLTIYAEAIIREKPDAVDHFFELLEQAIRQDLNGEEETENGTGETDGD